MVGGRVGFSLGGYLIHRWQPGRCQNGAGFWDVPGVHEAVAGEDVVDQFATALEHPGVGRFGRRLALCCEIQPARQIPHPIAVALVTTAEPSGLQLRARRTLDDLGGGGIGLVVEVSAEHHGLLAPQPGIGIGFTGTRGEDRIEPVADRQRLPSAAIEGVGRIAVALVLVVRAECAAGPTPLRRG